MERFTLEQLFGNRVFCNFCEKTVPLVFKTACEREACGKCFLKNPEIELATTGG